MVALVTRKQFSVPYVSGEYFHPDGMLFAAAGVAGADGQILLTPGEIRRRVAIGSLVVRIGTAAAGGLFQLSLYASDPVTNKPTGAPLFTSSSQATDAAGAIEVTGVGLTLEPGLYYCAVQPNTAGAPAVFVRVNANSFGGLMVIGMTSTTNMLLSASNITGYQKAGTFGTWPTFTGSGTAAPDSLAAGNNCPVWAFKVA